MIQIDFRLFIIESVELHMTFLICENCRIDKSKNNLKTFKLLRAGVMLSE